MFAPESVFDKPSPRPRGFYHPSPYTQQEDTDPKPQQTPSTSDVHTSIKKTRFSLTHTDRNINALPRSLASCSGSTEKFVSEAAKISKENAGTSIDDLIRDIDRDLLEGPDANLPVAHSKVDIGNILSVSDNSDTNVKVMSPSSLRYYMDRFKHSDPTNPARRKPLSDQEKPSNSSESDLDYSSLLLNTSSFLDAVVSSDNTTVDSFSSSQSTEKSHHQPYQTGIKVPLSVSDKKKSKPEDSYIKSLTGKSFSELADLVPKTILNPSNESEDILYQWRLKRRIVEAQSQEHQHTDHIPQTVIDGSHVNHHTSSFSPQSDQQSAAATNCSRYSREVEIQTDAEKTEIACQADFLPFEICDLDQIHLDEVRHMDQDSCSDISISDLDSLSSDDLTDISDLDDNEITKFIVADGESEAVDEAGVEQSANDSLETLKSDRETPTCEEVIPEKDSIEQSMSIDSFRTCASGQAEISPISKPPERPQPSARKNHILSAENSDELKFHLENIKESFDDELLSTFIDKYQTVMDQMKVIESEIQQKCNED